MKLSKSLMIILLSLSITIQFVLVSVLILSYWPLVPQTQGIFARYVDMLKPEHDTRIYHLAILLFISTTILFKCLWAKKDEEAIRVKVVPNLIKGTFLSLPFLYHMAQFIIHRPTLPLSRFWAWVSLLFLCVGMINFSRLDAGIQAIKVWWADLRVEKWRRLIFWPLLIGGIISNVFVNRVDAVIAKQFFGEQWHHNDSFIMGPVFAVLSGLTLNADVISQYGIGFAVWVSLWVKCLGGFSYERVMTVMIGLITVYYLFWIVLLRNFIQDRLLIAVALILMMTCTLFHSGAYPLVLTYGSQTPVRYFYDVFWLWTCLQYFGTRQQMWLWAAITMSALGVVYMTSEGAYATAALFATLFFIAMQKDLRAQLGWGWALIFSVPAIWFSALCVGLLACIGSKVWDLEWYGRLSEFINYFTSGFGLAPMSKALQEGEGWVFAMSVLIPLFYLSQVIWAMKRMMHDREIFPSGFRFLLGIYGLGTYHYYVARSVMTNYDVVAIPAIVLLVWWIKELLTHHLRSWASQLRWGLLLAAALFMMSRPLWWAYPHLFHPSPNPHTDMRFALPLPDGRPYFNHLFRQEVGGLISERDFINDDEMIRLYHAESDFSKDAAIIQQTVPPFYRVPVIASFEIELLHQAKRLPYFYYFPLVISTPLRTALMPAISIYTKDQMQRVIDQMENDKPAIVIVDKAIWFLPVQNAWLYRYPTTMILLDYVKKHYEPYQEGPRILAVKRR